MTAIQFWLICAAIYDASYQLKKGGKHFIITIYICLLMALWNTRLWQAYLEGWGL